MSTIARLRNALQGLSLAELLIVSGHDAPNSRLIACPASFRHIADASDGSGGAETVVAAVLLFAAAAVFAAGSGSVGVAASFVSRQSTQATVA